MHVCIKCGAHCHRMFTYQKFYVLAEQMEELKREKNLVIALIIKMPSAGNCCRLGEYSGQLFLHASLFLYSFLTNYLL